MSMTKLFSYRRGWLSVDPLYYKSPTQTPYHYVNNNPINFIDPDGRHGYQVDADGNISSEPVDDTGGDEFDVLYNHDMTQMAAATYEPGILSGGNIRKGQVGDQEYTFLNINDDELAEITFEFLASNGEPDDRVEWSRLHYDDVDGHGPGNILATSHKKDRENGGVAKAIQYSLEYGFEVNMLDHSHGKHRIRGNYFGPSGWSLLDASRGTDNNDLGSAGKLEALIPGVKFRVFDVQTGKYVPYNSKGPIKK